MSEEAEEALMRAGVDQKRRVLELAQAELNARAEALQHELAVKWSELELLLASEERRLEQAGNSRQALRRLRSGGEDLPSAPG